MVHKSRIILKHKQPFCAQNILGAHTLNSTYKKIRIMINAHLKYTLVYPRDHGLTLKFM